jgi:hypothetical protein
MRPMEENPSSARFPTTCWSRVVAVRDRATPEAREALAGMCAAYWYPIYAFVRRRGYGAEQALDVTQDYFARLLERSTVAAADPGKGRFRSFLLADCTRLLADCYVHDNAAKRGGGTFASPRMPARPSGCSSERGRWLSWMACWCGCGESMRALRGVPHSTR